MSAISGARVPRWSWVVLGFILVFDVWYRCHTIGPTVQQSLGARLWPVTRGTTEPLDCDEAAYAYIGRRIVAGAVLYRDLTENKPPGGYWHYALAVAIGGANELTIRLMPIPMVLLTIILVWWTAMRLQGPGAASIGALVYAIVSSDPYVFGNGANMEHAINLFATASLALVVHHVIAGSALSLVAAGACVGVACLVKQVAITHLVPYGLALLSARAWSARRSADLTLLIAGFAIVWLAALALLAFQGALAPAYDDIVLYGGALVTDTPPDAHAPPFLVRWVVGNADPGGGLPPPFGKTRYLVWWGSGTWPLWIVAGPALAWLFWGPRTSLARRLVAGWTLSACVQVALPRLFWPHYYLLPLPGVAIAVAIALADLVDRSHTSARAVIGSAVLLAAVCATAVIGVRDYLLVPPEELTIRYKGGKQWVVLRAMGRDIGRRAGRCDNPRLFVWGWQSPLYLYSGLDGVTPQVFVDPLMKAYADTDHPLIRPRLDRTMSDLRAHSPLLIFAGDPPFPALREFLYREYLRSSLGPKTLDGRGLWVKREEFSRFEAEH
jgi:4-amino-4-deoxy-L-arabinose transferase-like glycosyltransferase